MPQLVCLSHLCVPVVKFLLLLTSLNVSTAYFSPKNQTLTTYNTVERTMIAVHNQRPEQKSWHFSTLVSNTGSSETRSASYKD